jgi:curved DNA-binding protein CbpA
MITTRQNYYEILEISEDASLQEVERAYQNAKETYSPDGSALYSMFSREEVMELRRLIEEAYSTLSNKELRQAYDNENVNLSFSSEDSIFQSKETPSKPKNLQQSHAVLDTKSGFLKVSYKEDLTLEKKIKDLSDCSGSFIQKIRTYKNISLEDISKFSKISKTNILAIENEDFENLPAKVFIRGFVVQICKLLGFDAVPFSKEYMKIVDAKRN